MHATWATHRLCMRQAVPIFSWDAATFLVILYAILAHVFAFAASLCFLTVSDAAAAFPLRSFGTTNPRVLGGTVHATLWGYAQ